MVFSSGIGPQGKFKWFLYFHGYFWGSFAGEKISLVRQERKRYFLSMWVWELVAHCRAIPETGSACFVLCSFNNLFSNRADVTKFGFRAASYFKQTSYYSFLCGSSGPKLLSCYILRCFPIRMYEKVYMIKIIYGKMHIHSLFHFLTLWKQVNRDLFHLLLWLRCLIFLAKSDKNVSLGGVFGGLEVWG